jgi:hypothetical protein
VNCDLFSIDFSQNLFLMKRILLSLILLTFLTGTSFSQNNIELNFIHEFEGQEFNLADPYAVTADYDLNITRLQYYISEIEVTHDGGQVTAIENTWLLVNASEDSSYDLGSYDITTVESVGFWIGVDAAHNHLDPASYESDHPLAYILPPSMHWGWAAGYRFVALEGKTGSSMLITYEIHALGDGNYTEVDVATGAIQDGSTLAINLGANYNGLFNGLNVSGGVINHGETGVGVTLIDNMSTDVFYAMDGTNSVSELDKLSMKVTPNPSNGISTVWLSERTSQPTAITVYDLAGKVISSENLRIGSITANLDIQDPGMYIIQVSENQGVAESIRWIRL